MISCRFGARVSVASLEDRDTGMRLPEGELAARMLAMAHAEGHRPRPIAKAPPPPPKRPRSYAARVLALLAAHGPLPRRALRSRTGMSAPDARAVEAALVAAGLARLEPAPLKTLPGRMVLVITPAGRAQVTP